MKLPYSVPEPAGSERAMKAKQVRDAATEASRQRTHALTRSNAEEQDYKDKFASNFTKGLAHDQNGMLKYPADYRAFVEAINTPDPAMFDRGISSAYTRAGGNVSTLYHCEYVQTCDPDQCYSYPKWRGWESPRGGHAYDLEGPDASAVAMAPAPRVGSSELAAEMAEVYSLAILRDVPFTEISDGGSSTVCEEGGDGETQYKQAALSSAEIVGLLGNMSFYSGEDVVSSTPMNPMAPGLNEFERNRRMARTGTSTGGLTTKNVFRGSTKGAQTGPYLSQFMLIGADSKACANREDSDYPRRMASFGLEDGFIPYGSLIIDQRAIVHKECMDYMTNWCSWLDVQNGANVKKADQFERLRRFITTPRDLATYVHYDQLYEAYLNACLLMLEMEVPTSKGFPEDSANGQRTAFATYGGPHVLSLVTEVATRCLKAVRRQKFNYHRRARPEVMGGRFTLAALGLTYPLGDSAAAFQATLGEIPEQLLQAISDHNGAQNELSGRHIRCPDEPCLPVDTCQEDLKERNGACGKETCEPKVIDQETFNANNYLLPMAFPEGSPMHPAYGAGHATVAGGCVTILKAFFEMFKDNDSFEERPLMDKKGKPIAYVPTKNGASLEIADGYDPDECEDGKCDFLTIQGELDKLAANIAIGRNMAGVHYYSDYYDSLRMGERVAVGILMEQAPTYGEEMETSFTSFDGDYITISGQPGSIASISILSKDGDIVDPDDWWVRHVIGRDASVDLYAAAL